MQLAAAVATHGDQRQILGQLARVGPPQVAQQFVDSRRALVDEIDERPGF
jgi:hypothetical protein